MHKVSPTESIDLNELSKFPALPSQHIMDGNFFYGENKIIGNKLLELEELDFPMSYSQSVNHDDKNTIYLQWGKIFRESKIGQFNKYLEIENELETLYELK